MPPGTELGTQSIWPSIYPELLRLVREHCSTIVFVNNRRGAERLAKRLNEMNAEELFEAETAEEEGDEGPQASAVHLEHPHSHALRRGGFFSSGGEP